MYLIRSHIERHRIHYGVIMNYSVFDAESYFRFLVIYLECAGDFRVVRCLHSDQLVKKSFLCVVRRQLTPPPSSTNVERLFSYGGLVATDHRASLSGEKLDQILFLRENALMANFDLGWLWVSLLYIFFKDMSIYEEMINEQAFGIHEISAKYIRRAW